MRPGTGNNELDEVVRRFREHPGLRAKSSLRLLAEVFGPTDWIHGPGDDAAVLPADGSYLLAAGEAIWPPLVEADPYAAGVAAVVTNVNDIAAMGGRPMALVDTVVGAEPVARRVLEGMRAASDLYGVPVVGGHLTVREGAPAVSAFVVGAARVLLASANVASGQVLLMAAALEGRMREDFPFFSSIQERGSGLADDLAVLPAVAEAWSCVAAKDVSMAGLLGSLAMLLEPTGAGAVVDLNRLPRPRHVPLALWTAAFPMYGFLLCAPPDSAEECAGAFRERGLACQAVGAIDDSGDLRVHLGGREALLARPAEEGVTGLSGG
ncbi:MAG: AIR synthase related protein [Acidimicrobiia bacterium]